MIERSLIVFSAFAFYVLVGAICNRVMTRINEDGEVGEYYDELLMGLGSVFWPIFMPIFILKRVMKRLSDSIGDVVFETFFAPSQNVEDREP